MTSCITLARAVEVVVEAAPEPEVERRAVVEREQVVEPLLDVGAALKETRRHVQQPRLEAADGGERHRHERRVADALGALQPVARGGETLGGLAQQPVRDGDEREDVRRERVVISDLLQCPLAGGEPLRGVRELHAADGIEHGGPSGATGQVLEQ